MIERPLGQRFPKMLRLRTPAEFERVFARKVHAADDVLVARGCENGLSYCRMGLSVSRKVGNAVVRNQWKRRMREAFRLCRDELPPGIDFILHPKRGAAPDFHAIRRSLPQVAARVARRLRRPPQ